MMHYKLFINMLMAFMVLSCSSPVSQPKSTADKFVEIIRENIKDNALKNTTDCKIYSLQILKIDTILSNTLEPQLIAEATGRLEICNVMVDLYLSMSQTNKRINALNKKKTQVVLPGIDSEDVENDDDHAQLYKDSALYYTRLLDSLNKRSIRNSRFSDTVYQIRSFLNATEWKNNDSVNYFGLKYYYITKNYKVLELSNLDSVNTRSPPE